MFLIMLRETRDKLIAPIEMAIKTLSVNFPVSNSN